MDLFSTIREEPENIIHKDGSVTYQEDFLSPGEADGYFDHLFKTVEWKCDEAVIYGKKIITKRKVAWYGDKPYEYTYSNTTKRALPWFPALKDLKDRLEQQTGELFNSCLLNLYHSGEEGMAWHSDGETDLKHNGAIGSVSLGAERKFAFKHKQSKETVSLMLHHGSLLIMQGTTQKNWMHRLPPTKTIKTPRVNLTFRTIVENRDQKSNK